QESIDTILQYIEAKKAGLIEKVFVMGCLSQRYKNELKKEIKKIDGIYGVKELHEIVKDLGGNYNKTLVNNRYLTTPPHYAYLKIAEGCSRQCSFCAIPLIRGKYVSKPVNLIIDEAKILAEKRVKEIILIAQDLTYYGIDLYKKRKLADLLRKLSEINGIDWIRLHYTYPAGFPIDVLDVMKEQDNICNYIDIPLQHISDNLLKSMRRGISGEETLKLINTIRNKIPDSAIRTTLIVGYPGETDQDFKDLKKFIIESKFDRLGIFTYSHEEDTPAYFLNDNIPEKIKQQRADEIMQIQQDISYQNNLKKVGDKFKILIDREEENYFIGRTEYDSPEVDNEVLIEKSENNCRIGEFYIIKITKADMFDLYGEVY
ncbi:MAG: 30S ribosomal protein S12 methylthiotransferase RimO, partial [Bacteroidales bacterium]|nr:30S ribosomal protein S12 methylthiotransferase RimO [Bacteroidales bacterium]